jgi:hypothetical protein
MGEISLKKWKARWKEIQKLTIPMWTWPRPMKMLHPGLLLNPPAFKAQFKLQLTLNSNTRRVLIIYSYSFLLQDLEEMKKRLKEMEEEAAALRDMQAKVEKEMGALQGYVFYLHFHSNFPKIDGTATTVKLLCFAMIFLEALLCTFIYQLKPI